MPAVTDTVALRLFKLDRQLELTSLASLHAPQPTGKSVDHLHHHDDDKTEAPHFSLNL